MSHTIAGARGAVRDHEDVLRRAQAWAAARESEVTLADASVVFGRDHAESAALHAERSRTSGTMATRSVSMEALLYLAGRRQVADAIQFAGIREGTATEAVIVFGDAPIDELIRLLGWSRDDPVLGASGKDLAALGIAPNERGTVPEGAIVDLALERTAFVDVLK